MCYSTFLIELVEYLDERGRSVFAEWKAALDPVTRARIQSALLKLEQGNLAGLKGVGEGVFEMRLDFGPGFRVYLAKDGNTPASWRHQASAAARYRSNEGKMEELQRKEEIAMKPLTRPYSDSIKEDLDSGSEFRFAFLAEAINAMAEGDVETGKAILREYINGTLGFVALGDALGKSPKSLMRMLSRQGNPQVRNLFEIVAHLQKAEGIPFRLELSRNEGSVAA